MNYFSKIEQNPFSDLKWNIPERPQGALNIIGGNLNSFRTEIRISEFLFKNYPLKTLRVVLPDAVKSKLPPLDNFLFLDSTDSGSFAETDEFLHVLDSSDFNLLLGDFSKNAITIRLVENACKNTIKPLLLTRDAVDLIAENNRYLDSLLLKDNLILFASLPQLQKLFRSVYYPKILTLSMSLVQVSEALHKFTLSYPLSLITFNNGSLLVAKNGEIFAIPLEKTSYSPLTLWSGELAAKIAALNLFSPHNFLPATISAIL